MTDRSADTPATRLSRWKQGPYEQLVRMVPARPRAPPDCRVRARVDEDGARLGVAPSSFPLGSFSQTAERLLAADMRALTARAHVDAGRAGSLTIRIFLTDARILLGAHRTFSTTTG